MSTSFRQGYLDGRSRKSNTPGEILDEPFDLTISASSWDARSLCITEAKKISSSLGITVFFDARDKKGLRDKHDQVLESFWKSKSREYIPIRGSSTHVGKIWQQIEDLANGLRRSQGRPLRVLVDISACPRYYSLGVLALCFSQRLAESVTMFYAEGLYKQNRENHEYAFTGGRWKTLPVPYLDGFCDPGKRRFYLVSVGFEGLKTLRAVTRADPDRVSLLFPNPGISPDYVEITRKSNEELVHEYRIPKEQVVESGAGDAIGAWKALDVASLDRPDEENSYYLCCGTKPHAVALALRAIALQYPAVLYSLPEEHKVHETEPAGTFWRFDIQDVTTVPA